ncbi:MAG: HD domain-containing protein [Desulfuromonadales bacterium]|nr:HD domain-containing protein [Desulfuromonadales bacterium]
MIKHSEMIRSHVILQYTVITFVVVLLVTLILAQIMTKRVTEEVIQSHLRVFPELVRTTLKQHPEAARWFQSPPGEKVPEEVGEFFAALLDIPGVFRIKVWNERGDVLWSDRNELIGQNFAGNPLLDQALRGEVAYGKKSAEKSENITEHGAKIVLEVYSPVIYAGYVLGAVELYETDIDLERSLADTRRTVWGWIAVAGGVLYLLLFAIFYQAHYRYRRTTLRLLETQDVTIHALAYQSEMHDTETGNHIERTTSYVRLLAEELSRGERDRQVLTDKYIDSLAKSAPLHDIGKVGIPDTVLCKPGRFEPDEFELMKKHSEYGASVLRRAEAKLSFESFLKTAIEIAQCHHERWDGKGYPAGLQGEDIPLSARIMAIADIYDALRSRRRYKGPYPHEECCELIRQDAGKALDPLVVEAFIRREKDFLEVSRQLAD